VEPANETLRPFFLPSGLELDNTGDALARFLTCHAEDLRRGGAMVQSWRTRGSRRFGPYHRLTCRDAGRRQRADYLATEELLARARAALAALQAPRRQTRQLAQARQLLRRGHRAAQAQLAQQLLPFGLRLKGNEIRRWSRCRTVAPIPHLANGRWLLNPWPPTELLEK